MTAPFIQDLELLRQTEQFKLDENEDFVDFIKHHIGDDIDHLVHDLNAEVTAAIDCTTCGNCCRSLMINVEPGEPEIVSERLGMSLPAFKEQYVEESLQGRMIINTIPCHFLEDDKCTIYENRFNECREFPHLHKPGFVQRLPGTIMHYGRCPIIFNVIEALKTKVNYSYQPGT